MFNNIAFNILSIHEIFRENYSATSKNRNFHAISLRFSGSAKIICKNSTKTLGKGDIAYFPTFVDYSIESKNEKLIILHLEIYNYNSKSIEIFKPADPDIYFGLFNNLYQTWKMRQNGYKHQCSAILYTVFSMMERNQFNKNIQSRSIPPYIKRSFDYLHKNFTDGQISVGYLANMAGVSDVYFRRLFTRLYGKTPLKYINEMRITYACELLNSRLYTISEISEKSGFNNTKYFSTVFKKHLGVPPSEYNK